MLRKLLVSTVIAGCAASALAQPSILPFVADRVNDSRFLDIPSDDVVVDIAVSISDPTDAWTAGGLSATAMNGAFFDYATDPNTGANVLARPDRDGGVLTNQEKFSTFVSQPKDRTNAPRFRGPGEAAIAGAFDPLGPVAVSDPTFVNVSYLEFPPTGLEGTGWTSRLTLDVDNVLAANGFSNANKPYIDTAPRNAGDVQIAQVRSAQATANNPSPLTTLDFGVFIPEPASLALLALGGLIAIRRR